MSWRYAVLEIYASSSEGDFPEEGTPADWLHNYKESGLLYCDGDIETLVYHDVSFKQFIQWKTMPLIEDFKESIKYFFEYQFPKEESFLIRFGHLEATCLIESTFWSAGSFWTRPVWSIFFGGEELQKGSQMLFDDMWSYE